MPGLGGPAPSEAARKGALCRRLPTAMQGSPWKGSTNAGRSDTSSPMSPTAAIFEAFSSHPPWRCCCRGCRSGRTSGGQPRTAAGAAAALYPCGHRGGLHHQGRVPGQGPPPAPRLPLPDGIHPSDWERSGQGRALLEQVPGAGTSSPGPPGAAHHRDSHAPPPTAECFLVEGDHEDTRGQKGRQSHGTPS